MNAIKTAKSKWGLAEGWARKTIVTLISLLVVGASSYLVSKAINAPSASEVNQMIDLKIQSSPIMTRGAEANISQLRLDNSTDHQEIKSELKLIQGSLDYIKTELKERKVN